MWGAQRPERRPPAEKPNRSGATRCRHGRLRQTGRVSEQVSSLKPSGGVCLRTSLSTSELRRSQSRLWPCTAPLHRTLDSVVQTSARRTRRGARDRALRIPFPSVLRMARAEWLDGNDGKGRRGTSASLRQSFVPRSESVETSRRANFTLVPCECPVAESGSRNTLEPPSNAISFLQGTKEPNDQTDNQ
jgi:hypothetical protein